MLTSCVDAGSSGVRRFEVFAGAGGRRRWTREEKAAIIAESYAGVESVCAVAKRHGLRHTQLFTWRREMRQAAEAAGVTLLVAIAPAPEPLFLPAVIKPALAFMYSLIVTAKVLLSLSKGSTTSTRKLGSLTCSPASPTCPRPAR